MTHFKLSIILPIYNVEPYLEKCIRSLENQDISKDSYEIICVNDGSPDKSKEIIKELQKEFSNIVLINQENQGVSMARNNGIAVAQGKYIMPIDPDDYVLPNTFDCIIKKTLIYDLDVLYLGYDFLDEKDRLVWSTDYNRLEGEIYNGVEGYFASRGKTVRDPDRSVAILYRKAILDQFNICYPKNVPYLEDGLFLLKVFSVAKRVGFDNQHFYIRTTRQGSATNSDLFFSDKAINGFITAANDLREFTVNQSLNLNQTGLINHGLAKFVLLSLTPSILSKDILKYVRTIQSLSLVNLGKLDTRGLRYNYKNQIGIYNHSKILFFLFYRIINKI